MKDPNWRKCLLHADSKEVIKRIPDCSIDLIFTDPPYNIGSHSTGNIPLPGRSAINNNVAEWDWEEFNPEEWADEFVRILKPTGNLFIFTSYNQIGRWHACLDSRFDTSNFFVWHKTNPAPKIFKAGFLNSCEMIFTCWNKHHTWNFISQREMHNFFESSICMRPERLSSPKHPAQKPVALLSKLITIASNKNDIVFDPFMGVGSCGVAAIELERRFIGIEINKEYFQAAQDRIDKAMKEKKESYNSVHEQAPVYGAAASLIDLMEALDQPNYVTENKGQRTDQQPELSIVRQRLSPIVKWAGGKEKELKYILPNIPTSINCYYEPFVGGGSVFMAMEPYAKKFRINDLSSELICLYKNISEKKDSFFHYAEAIDNAWKKSEEFYISNPSIRQMYSQYQEGDMSTLELKDWAKQFCTDNEEALLGILGTAFHWETMVFKKEMYTNLSRKMARMCILECQKHRLPDEDIDSNLLTAIKSALYMYFRHLYNSKALAHSNESLSTALFLFIRNYSYSGMFRYNSKGEFNVPYGGIAYNSKTLRKKLEYYSSQPLLSHLTRTEIDSSDFEAFLRKYNPGADDFIFLDPPYDSEFSTYAQNEFRSGDQQRLASYLIDDCHARWMMIIKRTDFIYDLYANKPGIYIYAFSKQYLVSFMNRNNRQAEHLIITNYPIKAPLPEFSKH